jgi:hypothetical protein
VTGALLSSGVMDFVVDGASTAVSFSSKVIALERLF